MRGLLHPQPEESLWRKETPTTWSCCAHHRLERWQSLEHPLQTPDPAWGSGFLELSKDRRHTWLVLIGVFQMHMAKSIPEDSLPAKKNFCSWTQQGHIVRMNLGVHLSRPNLEPSRDCSILQISSRCVPLVTHAWHARAHSLWHAFVHHSRWSSWRQRSECYTQLTRNGLALQAVRADWPELLRPSVAFQLPLFAGQTSAGSLFLSVHIIVQECTYYARTSSRLNDLITTIAATLLVKSGASFSPPSA